MRIHNGDAQTSKMQEETGGWLVVITKIACIECYTKMLPHTWTLTLTVHIIFLRCGSIQGHIHQRKNVPHEPTVTQNVTKLSLVKPTSK